MKIKLILWGIILILLFTNVFQVSIGSKILSNDTIYDKELFGESFQYFSSINFENNSVIDDLPDSFCWNNVDGKDYTTSAKDQGSIGSCWAFAANAVIESVIEIREGRPDLNPDLSEQYLISCLPIIQEEFNVRPFYWIMDCSEDGNNCNGVVTESCFPYQENLDVPCSDKCSDWENYLIPITNFTYWIPDRSPKENDEIIKSLILESGPVTSLMEATFLWPSWGKIIHNPNSYFPKLPSIGRLMQKWLGLHVIVIYGWRDNPLIPSGGYWICKNSWGTDFGYDGFFNSAYGACGIGRVYYPIDDIYVPYIGTVDYDPDDYDWPP